MQTPSENPDSNPQFASQTSVQMPKELPGEFLKAKTGEPLPPPGLGPRVIPATWVRPDGQSLSVVIKYVLSWPEGYNGMDYEGERLRRIQHEVTMWEPLQHPSIAPFLGYRLGDYPCIVSLWVPGGNLSHYLYHNPDLPFRDRLELLRKTASAVAFLHSRDPPVCHGNIEPDHVLIGSGDGPKLCDFQWSFVPGRPSPAGYFPVAYPSATAGRIGYQAREVLLGENLTLAVDIFSFGCLMLKVLSRQAPHHGKNKTWIFVAVVSESHPKPEEHLGLPDPEGPIWSFIRQCWVTAPTSRPSIAAVISFIDEAMSEGFPEAVSSSNPTE